MYIYISPSHGGCGAQQNASGLIVRTVRLIVEIPRSMLRRILRRQHLRVINPLTRVSVPVMFMMNVLPVERFNAVFRDGRKAVNVKSLVATFDFSVPGARDS